jgi:hypothetical protein
MGASEARCPVVQDGLVEPTIKIGIVDVRRNITLERWGDVHPQCLPLLGDTVNFDSTHDSRPAGSRVYGCGTVFRREWNRTDAGIEVELYLDEVQLWKDVDSAEVGGDPRYTPTTSSR